MPGPTAGASADRRIGRNRTAGDAQRSEHAGELVLDDIGERADDQKAGLRVAEVVGQTGTSAGKARVLALA